MKIEKLLRAIELTVRKAVREELTSIKQPLVISNTRGHKTINTKQATTESRLNRHLKDSIFILHQMIYINSWMMILRLVIQ